MLNAFVVFHSCSKISMVCLSKLEIDRMLDGLSSRMSVDEFIITIDCCESSIITDSIAIVISFD